MPGPIPLRSPAASSSSSTDNLVEPDIPVDGYIGHMEKPLSQQLEPIAVVGMGCRLPGDVSTASQFWDLMMSQGTGQTPKVPASRFNIDAHLHPNNDRPGSFNVPGGYFLNSSLQEFDPGLFGITPVEAMWMDPQQRKLLEVVYETFESAGLTLETVGGSKTAVFVGSFTSDYQQMSFKEPDFRHSFAATGVDPGLISNRISHVFNLNGPSIVVNTACSSSVYAIHNACNALRNNECAGAVVGGTNLVLTVDQHMNTAKLGVLSPTSTCHTFDASADGYGRADAVGAVYLKRLSDAIRDGDPVRGVIRSSAVNSNGKAPGVGITHPNLKGQEAVIRSAYERCGNLDPALTGYFELHGTGTAIGDPLECHAAANAMNGRRSPGDEPLLIGAVKTNIGHSEAASGLSALIKAVLTVEKGVIPPTRGLVNLNPAIDWEGWKVQVVTKPTPFPAHLPVKRVSVNSFGYGGTNAHMIIESAESFLHADPPYTDSTKTEALSAFEHSRPHLLPFSAHDKATLKRNIAAHGEVAAKYDPLDLAYTLANRRSRLDSRGFVVSSLDTLAESFAGDISTADKKSSPTLGFVFTGQGAQWPKMGSELLAFYPSFLRSIRLLDRALRELPDGPAWTLEEALRSETTPVNEAEYAQPLCTAVQVALVQLLEAWGITPAVTVGHSSGEIAAAYAAGLLTAAEAIVVAFYRGKAVQAVKGNGAMLAVGMGAEAVAPYLEGLEGQATIACHNSPGGVTLSGDSDALDRVKGRLPEGTFARPVKTGGKAYHSHHMAPVAAAYERLLSAGRPYIALTAEAPRTGARMVSSVFNSVLADDAVLDATYWSTNLASPVLFNQAVQTIATSADFAAVSLLVEIGPHSAMSGPIKQIKAAFGYKLDYLPSLIRGQDSAAHALKLAGELFLRDYTPLDLDRVTAIEETTPSGKLVLRRGTLLVDLPPYQWNYSKVHWAEPRQSREHRYPTHGRHDTLGSRIPGAGTPVWRNVLRIRDVPWLAHHSLGGEAVFPAAGYFSNAIEAVTQLNETSGSPVPVRGYLLRDIEIKAALVTPDDDNGIEVIFALSPRPQGWWDFRALSIAADGTTKDHIAAAVSIVSDPAQRGQASVPPSLPHRASGKSWNQALRAVGFDYGPAFQDMDNVRSNGVDYMTTCDTAVRTDSGGVMPAGHESRYAIHPGAVDTCLQLIIASVYAGRINDMPCGVVPVSVDEVAIYPPTADQLADGRATAYARTLQRGLRSSVNGVEMVAKDGALLMQITNLRGTSYEAAVPQHARADIAPQPYQEMVWAADIDHLNAARAALDMPELVRLALHKDSSLKVLELGHKHADAVLTVCPEAKYTATAATDETTAAISAEGKPSSFNTQRLDIHQLPADQGVADASFDVVIAPGKLLDDAAAVNHIRSVAGAGGRVFWDLSTPVLSDKAGHWDVVLPKRGAAGSSIAMWRIPEASSTASNGHVAHGHAKDVQLVYRRAQLPVLAEVKSRFEQHGWTVAVCALEQCLCGEQQIGPHVVVMAELEGPLLASLQENELTAIQSITSRASSVLWISQGGLLKGAHPEYAMASGLARSITSEQVALDYATLDFDPSTASASQVASVVVDVFDSRVKAEHEDRSVLESEFCFADGQLHVSRLAPSRALNAAYAPAKAPKPTHITPSSRLVGRAGHGKVIFEHDSSSPSPLSPSDVAVSVAATALHPSTLAALHGTSTRTTLTHALLGTVTAVGASVTHLAPGDAVVGLTPSSALATHIPSTPAALLSKLSPTAPRAYRHQLLAHLLPLATATHALAHLAALKPAETVLVLDGSGAAGAAAVSVAKALAGADNVHVALSSSASPSEEKDALATALGLPASSILPGTSAELARLQPDVVFSVAGVSEALAREAWRDIAPFGRFVDAGRTGGVAAPVDPVPFGRGAAFAAFDALEVCERRPDVLGAALERAVKLYGEGEVDGVGDVRVLHVAEVEEAVAGFVDGWAAERWVVRFDEDGDGVGGDQKLVPVVPAKPRVEFKADASYLLVGCLGGLGRSLTAWMMEHGARHFVFLSRSGADAPAAARLVADLEEKGMDVLVVRGDVTKKADVQRAVASVPASHPIRGVIHAAMVLKDGLFASMSYSNWTTSTYPKVQGALNLDECLTDAPLDFFLMTSSVSGILGTPAQSNYAAANSFLDAMARHRRAKGRKATSVVLPMVLGVGVVAENFEIEESLKRKGMYGIEEQELLEAFEAALLADSGSSLSSVATTDHVVAGLDPARLQKSVEDSDAEPFWFDDERFSILADTVKAASAASAGGASSSQSVSSVAKAAATPEQAVAIVADHFTDKLSRMLLVDLDQFEVDGRSVASYGLDSMIGAELRTWIFKEYGIDMPFQQLLAPSLTIRKFSETVCAHLGVL